jgi:hypothetical protein
MFVLMAAIMNMNAFEFVIISNGMGPGGRGGRFAILGAFGMFDIGLGGSPDAVGLGGSECAVGIGANAGKAC